MQITINFTWVYVSDYCVYKCIFICMHMYIMNWNICKYQYSKWINKQISKQIHKTTKTMLYTVYVHHLLVFYIVQTLLCKETWSALPQGWSWSAGSGDQLIHLCNRQWYGLISNQQSTTTSMDPEIRAPSIAGHGLFKEKKRWMTMNDLI